MAKEWEKDKGGIGNEGRAEARSRDANLATMGMLFGEVDSPPNRAMVSIVESNRWGCRRVIRKRGKSSSSSLCLVFPQEKLSF